MLDLDYFKSINDTYGHRTGDMVLQALAQVYRHNTRDIDILARYGGEEFVVLLPNTGREGARACAEKMHRAIGDKPVSVGAVKVHVTASLGVSSITEEMKDEEELLRQADTSLLIAKQRGRNRVCEWTEVVEAAAEEATDEQDGTVKLASFRDRIARLNADLKPGYLEYIKPLVEQLESSVVGAFAHSSRVARLSARLATLATLPQPQIDAIRCAALLHDLGKAAIPAGIWQSTGRLSEQEMNAVRQHPVITESLIGEIAFLKEEVSIIRHHHERWDGTGYPDGLAGDAIPIGARLLAICNAYDALRHDRPYRQARSKADTMAEITRCAGTQLDPNLVKLFERIVQEED
jgi:diguanylate cyclase (GGDEF)-like protein